MSDAAPGRIGRTAAFEGMRGHYSELLLKHLDDPGQPGLLAAYEFGVRAMDAGLGLAEMAEIHHEGLGDLLTRRPAAGSAALMKAAGDFCAAGLSPYLARHSQREDDAAALRHLNRRLEEQAVRIAHAIHDDPLQLVAATHFVLREVGAKERSDSAKDLSVIASLLRQVEAHLSTLARELHPCVLDHLGLGSAIDGLAGYFNRLGGNDIVVDASIGMPLPVLQARVLYRAIQDVLTNISAHAQARKVHIQLRQESGSVACAIRDDGAGFDCSYGLAAAGERGLGLIAIREAIRSFGGSLTVNSSVGSGTELVIVVPALDDGRIPVPDP